MNSLKKELDLKSKAYAADMEKLQSSNRVIQESIADVKSNVTRTRQLMTSSEAWLSCEMLIASQ